MGIQGLARRLEPYSNRYTPQQLEGYAAIIDGPGLAYEAHKLGLAATANQSRIPSYDDINQAAVRWLSSLEEQGIKVSSILFDGALPASKRVERLARTEQNNRRIQQLRASYATTACPIPTYLGSTSYAFLAPSLREALSLSSFASRTSIVPGEADDTCALLAKDFSRSIIFTSDTDLLLFNYHPETLIVLFQDGDALTGLKAYAPEQIAQKLQLTSLIPLAHAIQQRTSEGTDDLLRDARNFDKDSTLCSDFSKRYTSMVVPPTYLSKHSGLLPMVQSLDVRISEFVHEAFVESLFLPIYLPLLVEDPNQASAWHIAQDIRTLAYSLLAPTVSTIQEYKRKAQGISPQEISKYAAPNMDVPTKELEGHLGASVKWAKSKSISPSLFWQLFALSLVVADLNTPPPLPLVTRVLNGDFDNTWAFVQLTARLHAAIYSLRMLKQIIAVRLTINTDDSLLRLSLANLHKHISTLPTIAETFMVPGQAKHVVAEHGTLHELVEEIYTSAGVEVPIEQVSNKKKKRQARENERKRRKAEQRQQPKSSVGNVFALLNGTGSS